ncbi:MAG: sigma-54-dependent Fis family transcriptional regulator [Proteobacteria bacterium]|nr:sigma-54-dependent Fis family transcriptional regulator [Pseudomonadota bacterium]
MNTISFHERVMLVGDDLMGQLLHLARKAAGSEATVLVCGESGTGKELIARYIHGMGNRKDNPFLSINCAAIPEGLMEAELFGFEKGAFTGAWVQRIGKFERAMGGTLLLDEVTEMPLALQAKLLRVIQEGEIDRLGGKETIRINTRLIATSNKEPLKLIQSGHFREDLFYRLNVLRIDCPPLRGRKEAIQTLASFFLGTHCEKYSKNTVKLTRSAEELLAAHSWPGNIRELGNVIERAVLLTERDEIHGDEIAHLLVSPKGFEEVIQGERSLAEIEKVHIERTLQGTQGNKTEAAKKLGISVRTLRNKLRQYQDVA